MVVSISVLVVAAAVLLYFSVVINQEYERAVVFRLGSFDRVLGPGLQFKIPLIEWVQKVDYRVKTVNVQPQKVLTKDNVTTMVDAIIFYQVKRDHDEIKDAILEVENFDQVTINYGKTMLRAEIGKKELDDLLQNREAIAEELRADLDETTNDFGIEIRDVEIRDVSIPDSMERAMAAEAEAERERRARITTAEGELQAAARTRLASDILGSEGYKLRTLQTIDQVATENATIVTVPAELIPSEPAEQEDTHPLVEKLTDSIDVEEMITHAQDELSYDQQDTGVAPAEDNEQA
ncbi:MAG: SPFH domain-containing protein [Candidatus Nanohaloarchaeota archaeon QJJ-5]|nr:SPFH domain-containing protein [Candidatus Nanohaloarchaeota archaeon QJJ-5]